MNDLISRQDAIDAVCEGCLRKEYPEKHGCIGKECGAKNRLQALPSVERIGYNTKEAYPTLFTCSECGAECYDTQTWDCDICYCPNCGARMINHE